MVIGKYNLVNTSYNMVVFAIISMSIQDYILICFVYLYSLNSQLWLSLSF